MGRSLGSAVDYGIISRNLQRAENVYMAPNRIFNANIGMELGESILKPTIKGNMDVRVVRGLAPELVATTAKQIDDTILPFARSGTKASLKQLTEYTDIMAKEAFDDVSKLAGKAWDDAAFPASMKEAWQQAADSLGTGKTGRELFQEAAGNRASKLARDEVITKLTKAGFADAATAAGKETGTGVVKEAWLAGTKASIRNMAASSPENFTKLLETMTSETARKNLVRAGGLTLAGVVVWQGYKITTALNNTVDRVGKTLFGESWTGGGEDSSGFGGDNPIVAGTLGWGVVLGGIALMYVLFKPKQAVVVS